MKTKTFIPFLVFLLLFSVTGHATWLFPDAGAAINVTVENPYNEDILDFTFPLKWNTAGVLGVCAFRVENVALGTETAFELENNTCTKDNNTVLWIFAANLTHNSNTSFKVFYNFSNPADFSNLTGAHGAGITAVLHLADLSDSQRNSKVGQMPNATIGGNVSGPGQFGYGVESVDATAGIRILNGWSSTWQNSQNITVNFWVSDNATGGASDVAYSLYNGANSCGAFFDNTIAARPYCLDGSNNPIVDSFPSYVGSFSAGALTRIGFQYDGHTGRFWINQWEYNFSGTSRTFDLTQSSIWFGQDPGNYGGVGGVHGLYDEIVIMNTNVSESYMKEFYHLRNGATLGAIEIRSAGNNAPTVATPRIDPNPAYVNSGSLNVSALITDIEGNASTVNVTWYKNAGIIQSSLAHGVANNTNVSFLSSFSYIHFDNVSVKITANDTPTEIGTGSSGNLTISDTAPALSNLLLRLLNTATKSLFNVSVVYNDLDLDYGNITVTYFKNGALTETIVLTSISNSTNATSNSSFSITSLDNISVRVNGTSHSSGTGFLSSSNITYPSVTISILSPTNTTYSNNSNTFSVPLEVSSNLVMDKWWYRTRGEYWDVSTAGYDGVSFNVSSRDNNPTGLFFNASGSMMYVIGTAGDSILQYVLSSPWNVSTATYEGSLNVSGQDSDPSGIFFKPTGEKMFVLGNANNTVLRYNLSSPWNVSTATYDNQFDITAFESTPQGFFFNASGNKFYLIGNIQKAILQFSLSTAWDITTISYDSVFKNPVGQESNPFDIFFNASGDKLYVVGFANDSIIQYNLSSPWTVSSATYDGIQKTISSQESSPAGLFFDASGNKIYITGNDNDSVAQYTISPLIYFTPNTSISLDVGTNKIHVYSNDTYGNEGSVNLVATFLNETIDQVRIIATGIGGTHDIQILVNSTISNLDKCFFGNDIGNFSGASCQVNITNGYSQAGLLWINQSNGANFSRLINFSIYINHTSQTGFTNNKTNQRINRTVTFVNNDTSFSLVGELNVSSILDSTLSSGAEQSTITLSAGTNRTFSNVYEGDWITTDDTTINQISFPSVDVSTLHNVTFRVSVTFLNNNTLVNFTNFNYSYVFSSGFGSILNVSALNSTYFNLSIPKNGFVNFTWLTETIIPNLTEYIRFTCNECVSDTETLNEYSSDRYDKNVTLTSTITQSVVVDKLTIEVPNQFSSSDFSLTVYKNGAATTENVTTTTTGGVWDSVTITNISLSTQRFEVVIIRGAAPTPGTGGGNTGGGGGGGDTGTTSSSTSLSSNFSFAILPDKFAPDSRIDLLKPGNKIQFTMNLYNLETDIDKVFYPMWAWSSPNALSLADWCTVKPLDFTQTLTAKFNISASSSGQYRITCTIPESAQANKTYFATLLVWPSDYSKNLSKPAVFQIKVGRQSEELDLIGPITGGAVSVVDTSASFLTFPLVCLTKTCAGKGLVYFDILSMPFSFIDGFQVWMLLTIVVIVSYVLIFGVNSLNPLTWLK